MKRAAFRPSSYGWVVVLCAFLYFLLGAPGGMLADRYGTRNVALAGAAFMAAGLAAASFAQSVEVLYATYSIGLGVGIGLTYVPSVGAVQPWFEKRRVLASGIAVSGIGAGNLFAPPLAGAAFDAFGSYSVPILGAAALAFIAAAGIYALLQPSPAAAS